MTGDTRPASLLLPASSPEQQGQPPWAWPPPASSTQALDSGSGRAEVPPNRGMTDGRASAWGLLGGMGGTDGGAGGRRFGQWMAVPRPDRPQLPPPAQPRFLISKMEPRGRPGSWSPWGLNHPPALSTENPVLCSGATCREPGERGQALKRGSREAGVGKGRPRERPRPDQTRPGCSEDQLNQMAAQEGCAPSRPHHTGQAPSERTSRGRVAGCPTGPKKRRRKESPAARGGQTFPIQAGRRRIPGRCTACSPDPGPAHRRSTGLKGTGESWHHGPQDQTSEKPGRGGPGGDL